MTQEEMSQVVEELVSKLTNGTSAVRNVPFFKGDKLTFTLGSDMIISHPANGAISAWDGIKTASGAEISTSQILRKNNGLPLEGNTVSERFKSFCNFLGETDGTRTITIAEIRNRELIQMDGTHTQQRTMLFTVD